jgi:hypothetical protein
MNNQTTYALLVRSEEKSRDMTGSCSLRNVHFERARRDLAVCAAALVISGDDTGIEPAG